MTERLDAAGCRPLPEDSYPRALIGQLPAGKRVNLRVDVPNKHEENSSAVAYFQVRARPCVLVGVLSCVLSTRFACEYCCRRCCFLC